MKSNRPHFQIPDEETLSKPFQHKAVLKKKSNFDYFQHSINLSEEINTVIASSNLSIFDIPNTETIFKLKLDDDQKVEQRGQYERLFTNQGLTVRTLLNEYEAVVSSKEVNIRRLSKKVREYGKFNKNRGIWDYVKEIAPFSPREKIGASLVDLATKETNVDVNVIIADIWNHQNQLTSLITQFKKRYPNQPPIKTAELSDNTLSTHMIIPSTALNELASENFVLSIEKNNYFVSNATMTDDGVTLTEAKLDPKIDIEKLPTVAIIDDGIKLPGELAATVKSVYQLDPSSETAETSAVHGTRVASRCIFDTNLKEQAKSGSFTPRVQVIDVPIMSSSNSETELVSKIKHVVKDLHSECATFLLAYNSPHPFVNSNISMLGSEIDRLIYQYGINFITPSGNHDLRKLYKSRKKLFEDPGTKISAPADGLLLTSVGSISQSGNLSTFSRIGNGFDGSMKPGLVYPGGDSPIGKSEAGKDDELIQVIDRNGCLASDEGTSFSSPLAAADMAIVQQYCLKNFVSSQQQEDPNRIASFEAKALMYHRGSEAEKMPFNQQMGFGRIDLARVISSDKDDATYIRFGSLKRKQLLKVKFLVPKILKEIRKRGKDSLRVSVTVVDFPSTRRTNGKNYVDGYIETNFHMVNSNGTKQTANPSGEQGRQKWLNIQHFSQDFSAYQSGDWELTLECFSRPDIPDDKKIDYVVLISLEDITGIGIDLYSEIAATNRFNIRDFIEIDNEKKIKGDIKNGN